MISRRLSGVSFSTYTSDDIRQLSVKQITNPDTFDDFLHPTFGGLYDPALGPNDKDDLCGTCGVNYVHCPGHLGHIELPLPVYHPLFLRILLQVLKVSCFNCHKLLITKSKEHLFCRQLEALDSGFTAATENLADAYHSEHAEGILQGLHGDELEDHLIAEIDQHFNSIVFGGSKHSCKTSKNTTKFRQAFVKDFFSITRGQTCCHCHAPVRDVRAEYNSRLYLKPVPAKQVHKWATLQVAREISDKTDSRNDVDTATDDKGNDNSETKKKNTSASDMKNLLQQTYVTPIEVREHLRLLWQNNKKLLKLLFGCSLDKNSSQIKTADMFFMDVVPVPPSRFRPISTLGEKRFENPQTTNLNKVLVDCALIHQCLKDTRRKSDEIEADPGQVQITPSKKKRRSGKGGPVTVVGQTPAERLQNSWLKLQVDINCFMDSDLDKLNTDKQPGIRQILEKKEGLFRKHMMGKRVNYAARSVISPDPYLNTDEIGVPEVFAKKLTYPQPVTPWNCQQLRRAILNGPSVHPGAVMIENEDGRKTILNPNNLGQRQAIAKRLLTPSSKQEPVLGCKKVYRHLINGDVLLLNRQPTLHRPSIMAHKARVLPNERTIRLHYANCKAYNADFDGDEMNAHFPQNELARAEAYQLVSTNFNYLGPKDGKPLSGLIQDHMVAGVLMTTRGTLYDRNDYHSLVYNALIDKKGRVETLRPCILKPTPLWSGKQVVSTVLINIIPYHSKLNLNGRAKISDQNWPKMSRHDSPLLENAYKDPHLNEAAVIFRNGELITGILDKSQYGSTPLGLVHCVYELYGGEISGKLLSTLARLFTNFHRLHGFTLGVEDILVTSKADQKRRKFMQQARKSGTDAATTALGLEDNCEISELNDRLQKAQHSNKGIDLKQLDLCVKKKTDHFQNKINSACVPYGLIKQFPNNALQLMVQSGAKGSAVNCMQISSLLGQIELEGRRPPLMLSGRSLPSFVPYDTSPRAGGFVDGRFLTGIRPQEYFFHCMAGREGLVDTAVKTSRSGYLQRCLIKHLEGLMVNYDLTVRDGDGSVVQFLYGEDGIDVSKAQFLEDKQYGFIARNYKGYINQLKPHRATDALERKKATKLDSKISKWKHKHGEPFSSPLSHNKPSPYLLFEKDNKEDFQSKYSSNTLEYSRSEVDQQLIDTWHKLNGPTSHHYERKCRPCPDPVISVLPPDQHYGSVSENFASRLNSYVDRNPDDVLDAEDSGDSRKLRCDKFLALMWFKYARSLSNPGEAVGLLAGQSLGEPSTQMTLNTFHFAGRGEMNVTLGIPRLREILMTASAKIKTPTMDVLIKEGPKALRKATRLQKKLNRVTLSEVIEKIEVWEVLSPGGANDGASSTRSRQFRIRVEFLPRSIYKDDCALKPGDVLSFVERTFIRRIIVTVTKTVRLKEKQRLVDSRTEERQRATAENEDEEGGRESPEPPDEDDEDDADLSEDDVEVDADAANQKERQRRTQFTSYEEPDDEELKNIEASDNEEEDSTKVKSEMEDVETESNTNITIDNLSSVDQMDPDLAGEEDIRVATVLASAPQVVGYRYDKEKERWCEVTLRFPVIGTKVMLLSLIEKLAEKAVLNESPGIKRCFVSESNDPKEKGRHRLKTEGVNLTELWNSPETLELNSLYTNEIHAFAKTYGIEAARRVLIKEITNVFKVYGIEIDPRHLNLVGDYMTFEGAYKPFNRQGIESNPFPLQKMTFETTTHFLRQASAFGRVDNLGSPSSRLVVGRVVNSGTGLFELRQPLTL